MTPLEMLTKSALGLPRDERSQGLRPPTISVRTMPIPIQYTYHLPRLSSIVGRLPTVVQHKTPAHPPKDKDRDHFVTCSPTCSRADFSGLPQEISLS